MPLTPADVHNVAFGKPSFGKRGYNADEVDAFLDLVENELTRLTEELIEARSDRKTTDADVVSDQVLTLAQDAADRLTGTAKAEADKLMSDARERAVEIVAESYTQISEAEHTAHVLEGRIEQLRTFEQQHRTQLKDYLQSQLDDLGPSAASASRGELEGSLEQLRSLEREHRARLKSYLETQLEKLAQHDSATPATIDSPRNTLPKAEAAADRTDVEADSRRRELAEAAAKVQPQIADGGRTASYPTHEAQLSAAAAARRATLDWIKKNVAGANDHLLASLAEGIDRAKSESCDLKILIPPDMSRTGRALYGISCLDDFHGFELTTAQAGQLSIRPGGLAIQSIGGPPRGDTRQAPTPIQIGGLRINNGAPVPSDAPLRVAIYCSATGQLPRDLRLRVGYEHHSFSTWLSPPISDLPPDGALQRELPPLAQDGWDHGPVPVCVDLVVLHGDGDNRYFTVVSNTLSALVDAIPAANAPHANEFDAGLARWLGSVAPGGPDSSAVANIVELINDIVRTPHDFTLKIGAKWSATSTAYYAFSCAAGVLALPMTAEQSEAAGFNADGVLLDRISLDANDMRPHIAEVRNLQLQEDRTASGELVFRGTVQIRFQQRPPGDLMMRVTRVGYTTSLTRLQFPGTIAEGTAYGLPVELGPEDWAQSPFRPGPLLVDFCTSIDSDTPAVSNCVVALLADTRSTPPPTLIVAAPAPAGLSGTRGEARH
jgi:DivIVA domain-containing protein